MSTTVNPDVSITNEKKVNIMFIEVTSLALKNTVSKFYYVLVLQLIYVRSFSKETLEVIGFILPTRKAEKIMLVTVRWDATSFKFVGRFAVVPKGKFFDRLHEVINKQVHYFDPKEIYFSNIFPSKDIATYLEKSEFEGAVFQLAVSVVL